MKGTLKIAAPKPPKHLLPSEVNTFEKWRYASSMAVDPDEKIELEKIVKMMVMTSPKKAVIFVRGNWNAKQKSALIVFNILAQVNPGLAADLLSRIEKVIDINESRLLKKIFYEPEELELPSKNQSWSLPKSALV